MPELTDEDIEFIRELRDKHESGSINRRQALGALGAAGVGVAGGFLGSGTAAADPSTSDSDGNVGTPSDPVDVFAEGIDSNSISTEQVTRSGTPAGTERPLFSTEQKTVIVDAAGGGDFTTIQEAMWNIPLFTLHKINIQIEPGDYTSEGSILVPPTVTSYVRTGDKTEDDRLNIYGNGTSDTDVKTGGWVFDNIQGFKASLGQIEITEPETIDNESSALGVYGSSAIGLGSLTVSGTGHSAIIQSYGSPSNVYLANTITFTGDGDSGLQTKHHGKIAANASADFVNNGTLSTGDVIQQISSGGPIRVEGTFSAVSDVSTDVFTDGLGPVYYNGVDICERLAIRETVFDNTQSFNSGETRTFEVGTARGGNVDPSLGDRLVFHATPWNDPDNDHGYSVDKHCWDDANSRFLLQVTETEGAGGGTAQITGWRIRV